MTTGTSTNSSSLYTQQRFVFMTIDPVHIGAGGYRLGRVDMTIAREPGTNLPKIPGTSIAGATRSYAAMRYNKRQAAGQHKALKEMLKKQQEQDQQQEKQKLLQEQSTQQQEDQLAQQQNQLQESQLTQQQQEQQQENQQAPQQQSRQPKSLLQQCPILYTFGTATDNAESGNGSGQGQTGGTTQAGTVSMGDAQILFFPVNSMAGPVWVSTVDRLEEAWKQSVNLPEHTEPTNDQVVTSLNWNKELNLSWLLFGVKAGLTITPPTSIQELPEWKAIARRIVLVPTQLFSQIVNSNLEVRTSVSINPETGAAESGALFTYEALPRATWLWSDVIEDDYKRNFPITSNQYDAQRGGDDKGDALGETWSSPLDVVRAGVTLIEYLGIGGMGTRGFGRMRRVADWDTTKRGMR